MIDGEDDTLDLTNVADAGDADAVADDQRQAPAPEDDELVIEIEGEEAESEEENTPLARKLRGLVREVQRENAELRKAVAPAAIEVGKKPDLWDDCEGDPDKFETELLAWNNRKAAADKQQTEASNKNQALQQVFQKAYTGYQTKASALGVTDFKDAENAVVTALPITVQSAIIQYAQDSAKLVLALGRNPGALAKVAAEPDEMKQILMVMDMEKRMTVNRKKPPPPEADTIQRGSVSLAATSADKTAEKLLKQAQASGDMTPYRDHMRAQRAKLA